jgi:hypothetical protein
MASLQRLDQTDGPDVYNDQLTAVQIADSESNAVDAEDHNDAVLSQLKRIIAGNQAGNWYDNPAAIHGGDASLYALYNRASLEATLRNTNRLNLNDVAVPAAQNWVTLSGSGKPDKNIAIAVTAEGGVAAQLVSPNVVGAHFLTEVSGQSALKPENLVYVFNGTTGDPILSSDRRVYGLLQVGYQAVDGNPFADSGNDQGQISFVRPNATYDDLEACPVADIQGQSIVYAYAWRVNMADAPRDAYRSDLAEADPIAGATVSLDSAYDGGVFMEVDGDNVDIRLTTLKSWVFRAGSGGNPILTIQRDDAGSATKVLIGTEADEFNSAAAANNFVQGTAHATGGQTINVGKTAGVIDSTTIEARATTGDALLAAPSGECKFTSQRETALPLDDATTGAISALEGGAHASIAAAIKYAIENGGVEVEFKRWVAASDYASGDNMPGVTFDLTDGYNIDFQVPSTINTFLILNGRVIEGSTAVSQLDIYPGTTPGDGDLKHTFNKKIHSGDRIISIAFIKK